jgi:hypothetical protein
MKIPIFEEILLTDLTVEKLKIIISDSRIGKVPCYLNLSEVKKEDVEALVLNLEQITLEHNLHPLFPYPLYIVTPYTIKTIFPTVRTFKDLPEHYFKKVKRPNNKELQLLNKLSLKVDKIKNLELYKVMGDFKTTTVSQRALYNASKELYFLESLNDKLLEKKKPKS